MKRLSVIFLVSFLAFANSHVIKSDEVPPIFDSSNVTAANIACTIDINTQTGSPQPVYIRPFISQFFHPANRLGQIQMTVNQEMELKCSSDMASPPGAPSFITARCVSGQTLHVYSGDFNFNDFRCQEWPQWIERRTTERCYNNGVFIDFGYDDGFRWLQVFRACYDLVLQTTYYTQYQFTPIADGFQRNVPRPPWTQGGYFKSNDVYKNIFNGQKTSKLDDLIIQGQIAPMNDFILATEQRATFHSINSVPTFETISNGNWLSVEVSSRRLASDRGLNLDVYTGAFDIMNTWNKKSINFDLPAEQIPVPQIFYKILIDQTDLSGVVLITVNNPFLTLNQILTLGYILCPDVSSQINYISWQPTNLARGYSYACEVYEFTRIVRHIPEIINIRYRLLV